MRLKYLLLIIVMLLITGCGEVSDSERFEDEYEKYNKDGYVELDIDDENVFKYNSNDEIKSLFNDGSGVIFIGDAKNNLARESLKVLLKVIDNTDITIVHYSNDLNSVKNYVKEELSVPVVLFVVGGKVDSYHMGTIDNREELSDEDEMKLYNIYLDGVHKVLNDVCDERC